MDATLDAVNSCLSGIGEAPVDSVDDPNLDGAMALQVLHRVSKHIQARGWWFNKETKWKITPDSATGFMSPPINAISITSNSAKLRYHQFAIRDNRIYDVDNHTYDMRVVMGDSTDIEFDFIVLLDFEQLPPVAQWAISERAKRVFAQDLEVDQIRWQFQKQDEEQAFAGLYREDGRNAKRNYIRDSPAIRNGLGSMFSF